ncbi:MAG: dihydroorotate dehydrogenase electron transfer subunit [Gammaproteobacteria bacterium]|nr:dihydroorotate dehydrogenase electron transfer subunit [Gammaproteobacteria bacterium]
MSQINYQQQRDTIEYQDCTIISHDHLAGDQHLLRLDAPAIAATAVAGSFVHLTVAAALPLRRPISIMRVDRAAGWIDLLYKRLGSGTTLLTERRVGDKLSLIGPVGNGFTMLPDRRRPLLIGGGVGMPPLLFLADLLRQQGGYQTTVLLGSEVPFPFPLKPSRLLLPALPCEVMATMPLLDDWEIPCRLASLQGYPGCFQGYVTELARHWLKALDSDTLAGVAIYSCGPQAMLRAVAALAAEFNLPCQVSLEEFMACGIGGCAGCVVEVQEPEGRAMRRVCVDGPVFDAKAVYA